MRATDVLVLPADVALLSADSLRVTTHARLPSHAGDFVVSRPRYRSQSLAVAREAAAFLALFRTPKTVVVAVLDYCATAGGLPSEVLTAAIPLVQRARQLCYLVVEGSAAAGLVRPRFRAGARVAGVRVQRCVQLLSDVEVYLAKSPSGSACALKLLRAGAGPRATLGLDREVAALTRLNGNGAPRVLDHGAWDGQRYLVSSWCGSRNVAQVAAELRIAAGALATPVLKLCATVVRAYVGLHEAGLLHGDVHARNILVQDDGSVRLIDFASSADTDPEGELKHHPGRAAVAEYLEPECAQALALGDALPAPTRASEQYALAALCYLLATGEQYLDFSLVRDEWVEQVIHETPRTFRDLGLLGCEEIERVLAKALSKKPADRHPTLLPLARGFAGARKRIRVTRQLSASAQAFLASVTSRFALRDGRIDVELCEAPYCSVSYGASGIAYLFYRMAGLRGDAALLATADAWSSWSRANAARPGATDSEEVGITHRDVGPISLYHRRPGIDFTQVLISHAMADWDYCNDALTSLAAAASAPCDSLDLTTGQSGVLLGCAALLEALPIRAQLDRAPIEQLGRRVAMRLSQTFEGERMTTSQTFRWLGVAHGWAGALFAALRWHQASGYEIPGLRDRLCELADLAVWRQSAAAWPLAAGPRRDELSPRSSWCHGSAGYVLLWALADRVLPGHGFARCAVGAARHLWLLQNSGAATNGSLCCGYAGQGFAMLALFRGDADPRWLTKAHVLLERALARAADGERRNALYKGDVGIALLAAELTHPARSCMPVFEAEGWPARA